jgi:hypothetical protein
MRAVSWIPALGSLAVALLIAAGADAHVDVTVTARAACSAAPPPTDPIVAALEFLTGAVERRDLPASFRLATPELRHGISCQAWIAGRVPVAAFRDIDWTRTSYRVVAGGDRQVVLRVVLFAIHRPAREARAFLLDLREGEHERGRGWRVGMMFRVPLQRDDLPASRVSEGG